MTAREAGKQRRRDLITDAARALLHSGKVEFSMRALAEKAGVSSATPYNLFGSKQAVMFAVMEADLARYGERLAAERTEPPESLFRAVSLAARIYSEAPSYHRSVLFAAYSDGGPTYRSLFAGAGHALWRDLVAQAITAGVLERRIDADACAATLEHLLFACILEWVRGELSLEEMELRAHYGFALTLLGAATPPARERLQPRFDELQQKLLAHWRSHRLPAARTAPDARAPDARAPNARTLQDAAGST